MPYDGLFEQPVSRARVSSTMFAQGAYGRGVFSDPPLDHERLEGVTTHLPGQVTVHHLSPLPGWDCAALSANVWIRRKMVEHSRIRLLDREAKAAHLAGRKTERDQAFGHLDRGGDPFDDGHV